MRVGVDVGGTFTDYVGVGRDGALTVRKVSTTPRDPAVALWRAVDQGGQAVAALVHGTTIATNALLERRGARVVLLATRGFEDVLWLRRQERADLYDLARQHPPPLVRREDVIGVDERMGPGGPLVTLTDAEADRVVAAVVSRAPEAVAIALLFAFRHPRHEAHLARAIRARLPELPIVASSEVAPVFREFERTATTSAEAYLRPRVSSYVSRLAHEGHARSIPTLRVMASSGGSLAPAAAAERAAALALSGPAGGVVGARAVACAVGTRDALTLDMGGTSADASLVLDGEALHETQGTVAGVPLLLPTIVIETVSAGGGSIGWMDPGGALKVGPHSAGAEPGPASYGRGGTEATVTDALLALGWLDPAHPLAADVALDPDAAHRALERLSRQARLTAGDVAWGMVQVAAAAMARALKVVSVRRGIDPRALALVPFGGAGPLFGCLLAGELGVGTVVVPPHPGVLSALGLAVAPDRVDAVTSVHRDLADLSLQDLARPLAALKRDLLLDLPGAAVDAYADCRFAGQGYEVMVPVAGGPEEVARAFVAAHRARYGHGDPAASIEVVALRAVATRPAPAFDLSAEQRPGVEPAPVSIDWGGERLRATRRPLEGLAPGEVIEGPAICDGADATALVAPGWRGVVHESGAVVLHRARPGGHQRQESNSKPQRAQRNAEMG